MKPRFRNIYMLYGSLLVLALWVLTDPDTGLIQHLPFGATAAANLLILSRVIMYVALLHVSRKAMFDYFDMEAALNKALTTADGAGKALIGFGLFNLAIAFVIFIATTT